MTDAQGIIAGLRDGRTPTAAELQWFAQGLASGAVSDAQAGAFAMAVCLKGLGEAGRVALTSAMRDSGSVLHWDLPGPVLDKHSTGGLGDCVSLLLAPALAVCGAYVPMISGRGLGHTGGTLDKLEAIPGLSTEVPVERLREMTISLGCAIVAASADIAPADRRLYAVRDVTGTVESIDLITASILSKKLAAGLGGLVLDVKAGSGAFFATMEEAEALAESLVSTARGAGCPTVALVTDMNQPLAPAAGNALEVIAVMEAFADRDAHPALSDLTCALGGELLALGGIAESPVAGARRIARTFDDGRALERFGAMVSALGGPSDFVERWPDRLPSAPVVLPLMAGKGGVVGAIDARAVGRVVVALGGGRKVESDRINPAVGISQVARLGTAVKKGEPLAFIHAASRDAAEHAALSLGEMFTIDDGPSEPPALVHRRLG